jgi:hypothetical protein
VLYPAELRNLLMHLALVGLFRAKWSADIHEEWISTRDKLERTRILIDKHATDALVTGYENLIPGLQLPDPDDRHVLAAAIRSRADVIVTMNVRDFPAETLGPFGIEAQCPDEFILHLLDLAPGAVVAAAQNHHQSLKTRQSIWKRSRGRASPRQNRLFENILIDVMASRFRSLMDKNRFKRLVEAQPVSNAAEVLTALGTEAESLLSRIHIENYPEDALKVTWNSSLDDSREQAALY